MWFCAILLVLSWLVALPSRTGASPRAQGRPWDRPHKLVHDHFNLRDVPRAA